MGQNSGTFSYKSFFASGHVLATHWSDYSACAIPLNSVTRGKVWCVVPVTLGDAIGTIGWSTDLTELRLE